MRQLSPHFYRSEFACKCGCGFDTVDAELIAVLEKAREYFGRPIFVNSGCRCPEYNAKVGGSKGSQHMRGRAADIVVEGVRPDEVQDYIDRRYPQQFGLGSYKTFSHVDTRNGYARWEG